MAIYGVANPLPTAAAYQTASAADVAVTAGGAATVITTGALTALNAGPYYPIISGAITLLMGATAASAVVISFILGSGSLVDSQTVAPALLANTATITIPVYLVGANSASAWIGSGSTINLQVNPTGQNITVKGASSRIIVQLVRGPDL